MSLASELSRLKRDLTSLAEEIAVNTGARVQTPMSQADRRSLKAEIQGLIQRLDELSDRLGR